MHWRPDSLRRERLKGRSLHEQGIKPILSVVPDNQDQKLMVTLRQQTFGRRLRVGSRLVGVLHCMDISTSTQIETPVFFDYRPAKRVCWVAREAQMKKLCPDLLSLSREGVRADCWVAAFPLI